MEQNIEKMDPKKLLTSSKLEIAIFYLMFRDMANGINNEKHLSLYARFILTMLGAKELKGKYSLREKVGINDFICEAKKTFDSLQKNGFDKSFAIPVGEENANFIHGKHRISASIALNLDIFVTKVPNVATSKINCDWLYKNGFSSTDMLDILRAYADLKPNIGFFCLFATTEDNWNYIQSRVSENFNIVGYVDLDYTNNYMAFENLLKEIYSVEWNAYDMAGTVITPKIVHLRMAKLVMRVFVVEDNENNEMQETIFARCKQMKLLLRETLFYDVKIGVFAMHSSDTLEEAQHLKRLLLSPNNDKVRRKIITSVYRSDFLKRIKSLKKFCADNDISLDDVCVVKSATMEVLGIRESDDLDIVISSKHKFGDQKLKFPPKIEIAKINYARNSDKQIIITNDEVIHNYENHFIFMGCKFENLEITNLRKAYRNKPKDIVDCRLIQQFNDFALFFEGKQDLQQAISKEFERRRQKQKLKTSKSSLHKVESSEILQLQQQLTETTEKLTKTQSQLNESNAKIEQFYNSNSYKITAPLRFIRQLLLKLTRR
ncbi:MAG: hypothetical protein FWG64_02080 [Firmicutes bacterium]|nr:hypothetical protein [Bacillota bacterium]